MEALEAEEEFNRKRRTIIVTRIAEYHGSSKISLIPPAVRMNVCGHPTALQSAHQRFRKQPQPEQAYIADEYEPQ